MLTSEMFPHREWGPKGKRLRAILVAEIVLLWVIGVYSYAVLPPTVPLHFDTSGEPTSHGSKGVTLIVPIAFSIAPIVLLIVTECRFVLLQRVPYLVNLPASFARIDVLSPADRSIWINRYFEHVLELGVGLTAYLVALEIIMYRSMATSSLDGWIIALIVGAPLGMLAVFLFRLKQLSAALASAIDAQQQQ